MWAESAVAPADRTEMINSGLLVGEGRDHLVQAGELLDHDRPSIAGTAYPTFSRGSITYINAKKYGVRTRTMQKAIRGSTFRHLSEPPVAFTLEEYQWQRRVLVGKRHGS